MKHFSWAALLLACGAFACGGGQSGAGTETGTGSPIDTAEAQKIEGDALAAALADANVFLLDVRNPEELEEIGTVEGYVNIPIDELAGRLDELPKDRPILTA